MKLMKIHGFTIQCGEFFNYENFPYFKIKIFPNSLIESTLTWYATIPRKSIMNWKEMER